MDKKFYEYKPGGVVRILPSIRESSDIVIVDYPSYLYNHQKSDTITKYGKHLTRLMSRILKNSKTTENRKRKINKICDNICSDKV